MADAQLQSPRSPKDSREQRRVSATHQADKVNAQKEQQLSRLQALTQLRGKAQMNAEHIEDTDKKKLENAKQADVHQKRLEQLFETVRSLSQRCESMEMTLRENDTTQRLTQERFESERAYVVELNRRTHEHFEKAVKSAEDARLREVQELEKLINLRDKKLQQTVATEIHEETNQRQMLAGECNRLSEHLKEAKIGLTEDVSRMQDIVKSNHQKCRQELTELREAISLEKMTRERETTIGSQTALKRQDEMCSRFDARCTEIHREYKAACSQLTILLDKVRSDTTKDIVMVHQSVDSAESKFISRMDGVEGDILAKSSELMHIIDVTNKTFKSELGKVNQKMQLDEVNRKHELDRLQDEMAQEHLRREQDESAIINMMETFMHQVKEGASTYTMQCVART